MPVVPKVDVYGAGGFGEEHEKIDAETHRDDECSDGSVVGDRGGCRPAHVEDFQLETVDVDNGVQRRAEGRSEEGCDNRQPHESNANFKAGFKGVAEADADAHTEHGEDYGHHYRCTEADYI